MVPFCSSRNRFQNYGRKITGPIEGTSAYISFGHGERRGSHKRNFLCDVYTCENYGNPPNNESIILGKGHGHAPHKNESHRSSHENEIEGLELDEDVEWRVLKTGQAPTPPHKRHKQYAAHQTGRVLKKGSKRSSNSN